MATLLDCFGNYRWHHLVMCLSVITDKHQATVFSPPPLRKHIYLLIFWKEEKQARQGYFVLSWLFGKYWCWLLYGACNWRWGWPPMTSSPSSQFCAFFGPGSWLPLLRACTHPLLCLLCFGSNDSPSWNTSSFFKKSIHQIYSLLKVKVRFHFFHEVFWNFLRPTSTSPFFVLL